MKHAPKTLTVAIFGNRCLDNTYFTFPCFFTSVAQRVCAGGALIG
jgi:hypothetical protein